jgi:hypothetical protein
VRPLNLCRVSIRHTRSAAAHYTPTAHTLHCQADVVPVPQDDGPNPACPIAYSEAYRDAMDYFRAVYKAGEMSERALALTEEVIDLNAANYTAWQHRRTLVKALGKNLREELAFVSEMIEANIKNYQVGDVLVARRCLNLARIQTHTNTNAATFITSRSMPAAAGASARSPHHHRTSTPTRCFAAARFCASHNHRGCAVVWRSRCLSPHATLPERAYRSTLTTTRLFSSTQVWYHRRAIVDILGDGSAELAFTEQILEEDAKNYHSWQHRHWAMERFGLFAGPAEGGLDYVNRLLSEDIRNNSAWNHRCVLTLFVCLFLTGLCGVVCACCSGQ